jgi:hypothetical protein
METRKSAWRLPIYVRMVDPVETKGCTRLEQEARI